MDPDATLAILRDPLNNLVDRVEAVIDLANWIDNGGFLPAGITTRAASKIRQFPRVLADVLGDL